MKRAVGFVSAGMILALTACGGYKADHGTVIEHVYIPESHSVIVSCHPVGKITVCQSIPTTDPECWKVRVEDEEKHRGSYCLDQIDWEKIEVGENIEIGD